MQTESKNIEYKSLRKVQTGEAGFKDLAVTCVCLANAQGGQLFIGIEDKTKEPPSNQVITEEIVNNTITRLRSLCFNVGLNTSDIQLHSNGGQYFMIDVFPSLKAIATTSDGKIFMRSGDRCLPVRSEDIIRLASEKDAFQWELQPRPFKLSDIPEANIASFVRDIRQSDRVKANVKEYSDLELLEHYQLVSDSQLTNLGVLWLGTTQQRSRLVYPIRVQYIVYDENEEKIRKISWDDNSLNPKDLVLDIEKQAIELTYSHEFPKGFFRDSLRLYDERVIRELLINAIAHKSYTISGDIFIKVYKDRLEIVNPGGLPFGITKDNILHTTIRRNPYLVRVMHDLKLMEGEGTGYDLLYEISSRESKPFPVPESSFDTTSVVQSSKILEEENILLLDFIAQNYELLRRELIVLGIVARYKKILSTQLAKELQLQEEERLRSYVSKLLDKSILISRGVKKGTEYLINPKLIVSAQINIKPTLKVIEQPRLKALIEETLKLNPNLSVNDLHVRLGDIDLLDVRKAVYKLVDDGVLEHTTDKTYRKYWLAKKNRNEIEK